MRFFFCCGLLRSSFHWLSRVFASQLHAPRFGAAAGLLASCQGRESRHLGNAAGSFSSREVVGVWPLRVRLSVSFGLFSGAILRFSLRLSWLVLNQTLQIHSLGRRSIALLPGLGLAVLAPQFAERANPSFKRTGLRPAA